MEETRGSQLADRQASATSGARGPAGTRGPHRPTAPEGGGAASRARYLSRRAPAARRRGSSAELRAVDRPRSRSPGSARRGLHPPLCKCGRRSARRPPCGRAGRGMGRAARGRGVVGSRVSLCSPRMVAVRGDREEGAAPGGTRGVCPPRRPASLLAPPRGAGRRGPQRRGSLELRPEAAAGARGGRGRRPGGVRGL